MTGAHLSTPGPWTVEGDRRGNCDVKDAKGRSILTVRHAGDYSGSAWAEFHEEADAHLCAAAPDMYEALKNAVAIIRKYVPSDALGTDGQGGGDGWNDQSWPILDEYLHYMDAAIAKATGTVASRTPA